MQDLETDCGRSFEHKTHLYETPRGKKKVCDGTIRILRELNGTERDQMLRKIRDMHDKATQRCLKTHRKPSNHIPCGECLGAVAKEMKSNA